ncbi:hypothetical protein ACM01_30805 [Streptomyces viridochromogenes]|uniref:Uncharacterized protein n=1 Tax=Streptomyces viridochromogenes TaxID=1938 RepID=A0A0J7Z3Q6_STRVR|nr:hypothetical protein ACM01_30805 [Streptomyces viridochromogenes]
MLGVLDEPLDSEPLDDGPLGEGSSKSDRDEPGVCVGLAYGESEEDGFPESDPGPGPESGPAPMLGAGMSLPPVSADMPLPMFAPGMLPLLERVEVLESEFDELESEDEESDEEESDDEGESDDEEELELSDPLLESLPMSPPGKSDPDGPSYPSIRLSTASRARLPAFWPRLSRTPSAKVWGLCLRASRPASPPALRVAPTS